MSGAIPGVMQPGLAQPGDPGGTATGGSLIFTGLETLTYPQYINTATQRTLVASPGGTYMVAIASGYGNVGAVPDDGRWISS